MLFKMHLPSSLHGKLLNWLSQMYNTELLNLVMLQLTKPNEKMHMKLGANLTAVVYTENGTVSS